VGLGAEGRRTTADDMKLGCRKSSILNDSRSRNQVIWLEGQDNTEPQRSPNLGKGMVNDIATRHARLELDAVCYSGSRDGIS
jgi:hypothetical protein